MTSSDLPSCSVTDPGRRRGLARMVVLGVAAMLPPGLWPARAVAADAAGAMQPLPLDAFAEPPRMSQLELSPDGRQLAGLVHLDGVSALVSRPVDGDRPVLVLRQLPGVAMARIAWSGPDRLLVHTRVIRPRQGRLQEDWRLLSVRPDGSGLKLLTPPASQGGSDAQIQGRIVDLLPEDDRHVLVERPPVPGRPEPSVVRLDVVEGGFVEVHPAQRQVRRWMTDAQHRVRIGWRQVDERLEILGCDPDGGRWRTLWSLEGTEVDAVQPLGFDDDPWTLLVLAEHQDHMAVFGVDLHDEMPKPRLLRAQSGFDLGAEPLRRPGRSALGGVLPAGRARRLGAAAGVWDAPLQALAREVDAALPDRFNRLTSFSADGLRYLVHSSGGTQPGEYYLGERGDAPALTLLLQQYPTRLTDRLAGKRAVEFVARDGLRIEALLTRPPGRTGAGSLVLMPHGGPQAESGDEVDLWSEFLASRGHAVLEVNFRGSTGRGRSFLLAGLRRWGREMQDDLSDAAAWAVAQGLADPRRIAIAGASYGGYAALMGLAQEPQRYCCAISFAGVFDLPEIILHTSRFLGGQAAAERLIGRYWGDREVLRQASPLRQAERIRKPVLLVHGSDDLVVPASQSRDMAEALRAAGGRVQHVEQSGVGHRWVAGRPMRQFLALQEAFLAEHLGPGG
ncbi:MAG: prolyl oligopeptidase family serine peptidase [Sphaerotilus natans subsp. sulfidivorans]|uniref:S9 family peptidase n=1 Tax=Sphaerotilus sulfidivorans TaxID=639200 RepID=UPI002355355A|nr:prolyl oligopeptidase family serine peptidase [Sphaerotilus sulfidivorans]MCK6404093.1 prolyl oligopeptidase family serine peptidase [Sphaerotilus sulfidivorans]